MAMRVSCASAEISPP